MAREKPRKNGSAPNKGTSVQVMNNLKRPGLVATGIFLLSLSQALSESAIIRTSSLSIFPEEIKLPASGVHHVLVTATGANAAERDVTGEATFKSNHREIAEVSPA